jgi:hypothetical protein
MQLKVEMPSIYQSVLESTIMPLFTLSYFFQQLDSIQCKGSNGTPLFVGYQMMILATAVSF